jgi:c-di-GMP-related signal transduction protein
MNTFVARQPILDRNRRLVGYELLYRATDPGDRYEGTDGDQATRRVLANCLFSIGLERLAKGRRVFINFTRDLLLEGFAHVLPADSVVIEVLEDIEPDSQVMEACQGLKNRGYKLALDDFVYRDSLSRLASLADIIKVDFRATDPAAQKDLAARYEASGVALLAEKVETDEEFNRASALGYKYFQGYFFAQPAMVRGKTPSAVPAHHARLMAAVHQSPVAYDELERLVRQDVSYAYKLLRYINSARFSTYGGIQSIRQALVLLGEDELRKWVTLVVAFGLMENKPQSLAMLAMVRARFAELLGQSLGLTCRTSDLFLMGLFSLLDAMMDRPIHEVLAEMPLDINVKRTLLGVASEELCMSRVHRLVCAYERGDWEVVSGIAARMETATALLPEIYHNAVTWAEEALQQ